MNLQNLYHRVLQNLKMPLANIPLQAPYAPLTDPSDLSWITLSTTSLTHTCATTCSRRCLFTTPRRPRNASGKFSVPTTWRMKHPWSEPCIAHTLRANLLKMMETLSSTKTSSKIPSRNDKKQNSSKRQIASTFLKHVTFSFHEPFKLTM